jgi:hypothetical protein
MGSQYFARIKIGLNFEEKKQQNAFQIAENFTGRAQRYPYVENNRIGDHICYYNDAATVMLAPGLDQRGHETFQCDLLFLRVFGSVTS